MTRLIFFLGLMCFAGCTICEDYVNNEFRPKHYNFIVTNSYISNGKIANIIGVGPDNKPDTFREVGFFDVLDSVKTGDVFFKEAGKTKIILIRKDSTKLTFPCYCDGKMIE